MQRPAGSGPHAAPRGAGFVYRDLGTGVRDQAQAGERASQVGRSWIASPEFARRRQGAPTVGPLLAALFWCTGASTRPNLSPTTDTSSFALVKPQRINVILCTIGPGGWH